ncbi:hypothetical protein [Vibrio mediterranei]|uniref:hypothetical protein n=1 Tax=Vibrio mediterranei TaxID=689 RepID=UPI004067AF68
MRKSTTTFNPMALQTHVRRKELVDYSKCTKLFLKEVEVVFEDVFIAEQSDYVLSQDLRRLAKRWKATYDINPPVSLTTLMDVARILRPEKTCGRIPEETVHGLYRLNVHNMTM